MKSCPFCKMSSQFCCCLWFCFSCLEFVCLFVFSGVSLKQTIVECLSMEMFLTVFTARLSAYVNWNDQWLCAHWSVHSDCSFNSDLKMHCLECSSFFGIGNENVHTLTYNRPSLVYFKLQAKSNGTWYYAKYSNFSLSPQTEGYRLYTDNSSYTGTAG